MWNLILLLWSCIHIAVVVGAPDTVTGHRGERVEIRCSYKSGYESNSKYFCKGECSFGFKNIMVESGSPAKDERFSLTDDKKNRVFTVTITDLRTADEGQYWCAVKRAFARDVYSEILLLVKLDKKMTEVSTISPFFSTSTSAPLTPQTPLPQTSSPDTGSFGIIIAGVLVFLLIGAVLPIVAVRKKKLTCGLVSSSTEALHHTFRGEENDYNEGNPTVLPNSHTAQNDNISLENEFHRSVNPEPADTDLDYTNVNSAVSNSQNPDQIYTELNASRQSHIYQCLTADSAQEESIYHNIDQITD
ncbi:CMRF35-like molecule 5 [Megalobrama amblycephala]|uniref:CMRF35-like molecule 5 n=1 Tax=Megalobrama amblycephala TaxID=75352 RepID=UPI0020143A66|nr:CMRF35-like molecule 5 [Megalobrama amblycephala]